MNSHDVTILHIESGLPSPFHETRASVHLVAPQCGRWRRNVYAIEAVPFHQEPDILHRGAYRNSGLELSVPLWCSISTVSDSAVTPTSSKHEAQNQEREETAALLDLSTLQKRNSSRRCSCSPDEMPRRTSVCRKG